MKGNRLVKVYDRLTPQERFVLAVQAEARSDGVERNELARTCPRYDYHMTDAEFTTRMQTAELLAFAVMSDTQKMLGWLDLLTLVRPILQTDDKLSDAYLAACVCATGEQVAAARVKAVAEAFRDACTEHLGISGWLVLRAHNIPLEARLAQYAAELEAVERDEELYTEYRQTVAAVWAKALAPATRQ
jgi:hypothetical protein